jgi:hypothetical protein
MADSKKIVYKIIKSLNTIWHPESTLVFKSQKDKRATGRYAGGEFIPLDETALELCTEWDFRFDESLVDDNSEEGDREEAEEEEPADEEASEEGADEDQEEIDPPVVDPKATPEPKKAISSSSNAIKELAQRFTIDLLSMVTSINEQLSAKEEELSTISCEHAKLKADYSKLHTKFEGIKQLFA